MPKISSDSISAAETSPIKSRPFFSFTVSFMTEIAFSFCSLVVITVPPFFIMPHFSAAIFSTVSPSIFVWSSDIEVITAAFRRDPLQARPRRTFSHKSKALLRLLSPQIPSAPFPLPTACHRHFSLFRQRVRGHHAECFYCLSVFSRKNQIHTAK